MTEAEGFPPEPEETPPAALLGQLNVTATLSVTPGDEPAEDNADGE